MESSETEIRWKRYIVAWYNWYIGFVLVLLFTYLPRNFGKGKAKYYFYSLRI